MEYPAVTMKNVSYAYENKTVLITLTLRFLKGLSWELLGRMVVGRQP